VKGLLERDLPSGHVRVAENHDPVGRRRRTLCRVVAVMEAETVELDWIGEVFDFAREIAEVDEPATRSTLYSARTESGSSTGIR